MSRRWYKKYTRRHLEGYNHHDHPKKTNWSFVILIILIAVALIGYFTEAFDNFGSIKGIKDKVKTKVENIVGKGSILTASSEDFPCMDSLREYIRVAKIRRGSSYKIKLMETKEFTDKDDLKDYFIKWGGSELRLDVSKSIGLLGGMNLPLDIALIHLELCNVYGCDSWFEWGICKGENNKEFEKIHNIGWI